jgi:5-methylcytosine-specific restriction endonuclease McrA
MRSIILDATMEPLGIIAWKKAWKKISELKDNKGNLITEAKATVLWTYPGRKLHSSTNEWDWPAIIILKNQSGRKRKTYKSIIPSKKSILIRDLYTCQYCGKKLTNSSGTRDHVYPESKGGEATWENMVACCKVCQFKKSNKTCEESNMYPANKPKEPSLMERFRNNIKVATSVERKTWTIGLKKLGLEYLLDGEWNSDND